MDTEELYATDEEQVEQGEYAYTGEYGPVHISDYRPNWHPEEPQQN